MAYNDVEKSLQLYGFDDAVYTKYDPLSKWPSKLGSRRARMCGGVLPRGFRGLDTPEKGPQRLESMDEVERPVSEGVMQVYTPTIHRMVFKPGFYPCF